MCTSRFARFLALSVAGIAALGARAASAAPTTLGVEWEMVVEDGPKQQILFGSAFKSAGTNATKVVTKGGAEVDKRLLCSKLHSRIDPRYPLVTISYDLGAVRTFTLEVITGPIASTDAEAWNEVTASLGDFYTAVRASCQTEDGRCRVSIADALAAAGPRFTAKCGATAELTEDQLADVTIEVPARGDLFMQSIAQAGTQVSLAIDWARFARAPMLAALYDGMWDDDDPREWTGYAGSLSSQLFDYARKRLLPAFNGLTDVQRGFLVHYLTGLYAFDAYMLRKYDEAKPSASFASWVASYTLDDAVDWKLKSNWYLLPKEPLSETFQRIDLAPGVLDDASKFCAPELAKGLTLVDELPELDALATKFGVAGATSSKKKDLSLSDDEDDATKHLANDGSGLVQSCLDLYSYWKSSITGGRDPVQLATIASIIPSDKISGELRGVFELRRNHRIVDQHRLAVQLDSKRVVVGWKSSPLGLPMGVALPDDNVPKTSTTNQDSGESDDD